MKGFKAAKHLKVSLPIASKQIFQIQSTLQDSPQVAA